ncbi:hypothetical protein [Tessaracoccus coleopterorum]|uniref:hypothetical protein n=1 Tax=Tessaracoccus coleopterorum TaxID=2714950 RepID=UPI0018D42997|nr:hypothetical protein [Tessaracoccus coleopterorum]
MVGPLADDAQTQLGDWAGNSGQAGWFPDGHPRHMISTVLDGLRDHSPKVGRSVTRRAHASSTWSTIRQAGSSPTASRGRGSRAPRRPTRR